MTTTTSTPYDWLKALTPSILAHEFPSANATPENYSWVALGEKLSSLFRSPGLQVQATHFEWRKASEALVGIGTPVTSLGFAVGELKGQAYWLTASSHIAEIMTSLLTGKATASPAVDSSFQEGFLRYVIHEVLFQLQELGFHQELTPRFTGPQELPRPTENLDEQVLSIDLSLALNGHTYHSRLLATEDLVKDWNKHFAQIARSQEISPALAAKTEIIVHLEAGGVTLSQKAWSRIRSGDFILLDTCTVGPGVEKGRVMLTTNGVPLFRAMLKKDQIKILEHPLHHEVETSMSNEDDNLEEEFEDLDVDEEFVDDAEEEFVDAGGEIDVDEGEAQNEDLTEEIEDEAEQGEALGAASPETETEKEPLTTADKIQFNVIVEVGRLKISLAKLRDLQPGQTLELNVRPEDGVNLVINGQCVGRGELLRVGESLGVRILELG